MDLAKIQLNVRSKKRNLNTTVKPTISRAVNVAAVVILMKLSEAHGIIANTNGLNQSSLVISIDDCSPYRMDGERCKIFLNSADLNSMGNIPHHLTLTDPNNKLIIKKNYETNEKQKSTYYRSIDNKTTRINHLIKNKRNEKLNFSKKYGKCKYVTLIGLNVKTLKKKQEYSAIKVNTLEKNTLNRNINELSDLRLHASNSLKNTTIINNKISEQLLNNCNLSISTYDYKYISKENNVFKLTSYKEVRNKVKREEIHESPTPITIRNENSTEVSVTSKILPNKKGENYRDLVSFRRTKYENFESRKHVASKPYFKSILRETLNSLKKKHYAITGRSKGFQKLARDYSAYDGTRQVNSISSKRLAHNFNEMIHIGDNTRRNYKTYDDKSKLEDDVSGNYSIIFYPKPIESSIENIKLSRIINKRSVSYKYEQSKVMGSAKQSRKFHKTSNTASILFNNNILEGLRRKSYNFNLTNALFDVTRLNEEENNFTRYHNDKNINLSNDSESFIKDSRGSDNYYNESMIAPFDIDQQIEAATQRIKLSYQILVYSSRQPLMGAEPEAQRRQKHIQKRHSFDQAYYDKRRSYTVHSYRKSEEKMYKKYRNITNTYKDENNINNVIVINFQTTMNTTPFCPCETLTTTVISLTNATTTTTTTTLPPTAIKIVKEERFYESKIAFVTVILLLAAVLICSFTGCCAMCIYKCVRRCKTPIPATNDDCGKYNIIKCKKMTADIPSC